MFDILSLIGFELSQAIDVLKQNGYEKINVINNSKHNDLCDTQLVCSAKLTEDGVTLVCGEFHLDIKE